MGRPNKKVAEKAPAHEGTVDGATVPVDVDSFVRIRDSVVTGLATIQDAISTLSAAYIKHSNAILGEHGASLDIENALGALQNNPLFDHANHLARAGSPPKSPLGDGKKEKKKRIHDPNAPKRPLTPYFLYMQTARPIISNDLGPDTPKGAVSTEGVRRWNAMARSDKQLWNVAYTENLKLYNARMHSYKHGNLTAKDMSDEDALNYADSNSIGVPAAIEATVDAQLASEALLDAPADEDEEMPPPSFAPTPKGRSKSKAAAPTPQQIGAIIPPGSGKAVYPPVDASLGNKRKRVGKKIEEPVASIEQVDGSLETPKPKGRAKKAKA